MKSAAKESAGDIRRRFSDLAKILEKHNVAWTYDLLIDLDLYIASLSYRKEDGPLRTQ
jgi:hypothetical protein